MPDKYVTYHIFVAPNGISQRVFRGEYRLHRLYKCFLFYCQQELLDNYVLFHYTYVFHFLWCLMVCGNKVCIKVFSLSFPHNPEKMYR